MTNELFSDLNFLGLDSRGRGIKRQEFSLEELSDRYSFISFNKSNKTGGEYTIQNLQEQFQKELKISKSLEELMEVNDRLSGGGSSERYVFKALSSDIRKQVKQQLRIKQSCYDKLYTHYCHVKKENKKDTIMMLPVLLGLDDAIILGRSIYLKDTPTASLSTTIILSAVKTLNSSFNKMLRRLGKRKAYSVFKACSHVVLLGERNIPFLQVIFYYTGDITDYFIRDMAREWCIVNECNVWLDYVRFDSELSPDWDNEYDEFCRQGYYSEGQERYQIDAAIRNLILPFSKEYTDIFIPKEQSSKYRKHTNYLIKKVTAGKIKIAPHFDDKKRKKFVCNIKNSPRYHLYYLEQVAKQFTKIPTVTGPTCKKFTYQKGYIPKKSNKS